ncbi:MAG: hypothetical protein ACPKOI_13250 [Pleomorphochaeta sp.]
MTKKIKILIVSIISIMMICSMFYFLMNSQYMTIKQIEINIDEGDIPPTIISYLQSYKNKNIFKVDCTSIEKKLESNAFIAEARAKVSMSKKLVVNLNKTEVNAIIKTSVNNEVALICNNEIYKIEDEDRSIINNHLLTIEMTEQVFYSLLENNDIEKFDMLSNNIGLLNQYSYLISRVKYDNNVNNSFGFFELELNNTNMVIRFRDKVNALDIKGAIDFAQTLSINREKVTILDVYHGAIVQRNRPLGG